MQSRIKYLQLTFVSILIFFLAIHSFAAPQKHIPIDYMAKAIYISNYDGDTVRVDIPGLHPLIGGNINIRIRGIDTPEIRGKCFKETVKAKKAKKRVRKLLTNAENIILEQMGRGKYFRIVADIVADGIDIGETLIQENLAVPYYGRKKTAKWCD